MERIPPGVRAKGGLSPDHHTPAGAHRVQYARRRLSRPDDAGPTGTAPPVRGDYRLSALRVAGSDAGHLPPFQGQGFYPQADRRPFWSQAQCAAPAPDRWRRLAPGDQEPSGTDGKDGPGAAMPAGGTVPSPVRLTAGLTGDSCPRTMSGKLSRTLRSIT